MDGYARLVRLATAAGARAVVDSDGPSLAAALDERPWLVKVNAAEAESRHGGERADGGPRRRGRRGAA